MKNKKRILFPTILFPGLSGLPEKLNQLAAEGWNLDSMGMQNVVCLTLFRSEPQMAQFLIDYNTKPTAGYRSDWEQAGWRIGARVSNYFIWMTERARSVMDGKALLAQRKKLASAYQACTLIFLLAVLVMLATTVYLAINGYGSKCPQMLLRIIPVVLVSLYFAWASRALKKSLV